MTFKQCAVPPPILGFNFSKHSGAVNSGPVRPIFPNTMSRMASSAYAYYRMANQYYSSQYMVYPGNFTAQYPYSYMCYGNRIQPSSSGSTSKDTSGTNSPADQALRFVYFHYTAT